ncbi:major facilitator superfamily domain-containing protein [Mycena latifolia]|nr:major facilitator superfamily domain-containing protein [Mycena latifolia]
MTDESEIPLLATEPSSRRDEVYDRFTNQKKNAIVALVSWCGLLPLFVSGSFIPCIPQIAEDFDTTGQVVSLAVSISFVATSVGGLIGASYSSFYGRRPIYMIGLPLLCIGSIALGFSRTILNCSRAAPGLSVGAGVIGDIYALEKRGTAMGIFFGACLLGPALSPLAGGTCRRNLSSYVIYPLRRTSRSLCELESHAVLLALSAAIGFLFILVPLPETSHPGTRGVDNLWLLRSPNLLAVTIAAWMNLLAEYVLLVPLAYTIGVRYNITNEAILGAFFLPCGVGNIDRHVHLGYKPLSSRERHQVGAPLAGRLSDQILVKWKKRRGGIWVPEDRLRAALLGASTLVPLSVLFSGLTITYLDGPMGIVLTLCCLFCNGLGVDMVLNPIGTYSVDIFLSRSAEGIAGNKNRWIMPAINHLGIVVTHTLAAVLTWLGFGILLLSIRYGQEMRDFVDMDYTPTQ